MMTRFDVTGVTDVADVTEATDATDVTDVTDVIDVTVRRMRTRFDVFSQRLRALSVC